jgi:hypothetical protein
MPDEPRLNIPVLLGTIRAGRRSVHVARLLLDRLEGRDEVATALIDLADLDLPVMRHRLGETDAVSRSRLRSPSPGSMRRSTSRAPCTVRSWPPASGRSSAA